MRDWKLLGRMEQVSWNPPELVFWIGRHGGRDQGSTRAPMQEWTIDIDRGTHSCIEAGYRQLDATAPPVKVGPLAQEIAELSVKGARDPRLDWQSDGTVRLRIDQVLPSDGVKKQTLTGRRKRFHKTLDDLLSQNKWKSISPSH